MNRSRYHLLFTLFFVISAFGYAQDNRPNIIFIIADDISAEDLGCYGNEKINTPHIDSLALAGIRFTNAFVTSSSCSPSRCSIITGRYPHNTGAAELHSPLPNHLTYFPELLKQAGYYTAQLGKWHEGPNTKRAYDTISTGVKLHGNGGELQWVNFIKNRPKDKPFFFWFASYDAHRPWGADNFGSPKIPETLDVPPMLADTQETRSDLASYYNEIQRLDYYIGLVSKELRTEAIEKNTLIIFLSDNARPFPGSKTRLYDRGLRTPLIISWPAFIEEKGQVCKSLVSSIDIAPTILEAAQVATAESIQGRSFLKLLNNPDALFRNYIFGEHNWHDFEAYERSVRDKNFLYIRNWRPTLDNQGAIDVNQSPSALALRELKKQKLISDFQNDYFLIPRPTEEFYDINQDPWQKHNLIQDKNYVKQIEKLKKILNQWQKETGDTVPDYLTPDWYDRDTGKALPNKGRRGEMPGHSTKAGFINTKGPF